MQLTKPAGRSRVHARASALLLLGLAGLSAGACAPSSVARRINSVAAIADSAGRAGARNCAPEELALARVHLEFARLELSQGEAGLADRHLTLAEPNAKAALRLAEADASCARVPSQATHGARFDTGAGSPFFARPTARLVTLARPRARLVTLARPRARFDSSSRLLGAVGESRDPGRGEP